MAARRRRALDRYQGARHEVMVRGPEGFSKHWDEKGKLLKGKSRTEFVDYHKHMNALLIEAGIVDPFVQKIHDELKRQESFWGDAVVLELPQKAP